MKSDSIDQSRLYKLNGKQTKKESKERKKKKRRDGRGGVCVASV
jgi:hypothetical protein